MSTKPWRAKGTVAAATLALTLLVAACAGPAPEPGHSFSEVRFARVPPPPEPGYLTPPAAPAPTAPAIAPAEALARVQALLTQDGFKVETRAEGGERVIAATRMAGPDALRDEAACRLEAMRRPDFSATDLDVRLSPSAGLRTTSHFVMVDTNLLSGDLTRQTCRSNGALEAAVRRAAGG